VFAALVDEVHSELKRLMIAGSEYCRGDGSLKRLDPKLRDAGTHAAVFIKLADLIQNCHSPPEGEESVTYLPEAFSLINAAKISLCTHDTDGVLVPLAGTPADIGTPLRHSELNPLIDALTKPQPGRIETAVRGLSSITADLRLLPALNAALDDNCAEISKLAARSLLQAGSICVPLLEQNFSQKRGSKGNVRRFTVLALLKNDDAFIADVLKNGVRELRKQAADLLRDMEKIRGAFENKEAFHD
jgi:hypothetical protein